MTPPDSPLARHPLLSGKRVALCVTGSIAAYKAAALARLLVKEGAQVTVLMSDSARELVGPATFSGITGDKVYGNMFETGGELHVELARSCQAVIVFPATADSLARFAQGRANDLIAALLLCTNAPVLIAPAMHPAMWHHPATQRNVATLQTDGRATLVGPVEGEVASGDTGMGRMVEPDTMLHAVRAALTKKDLQGRRLLITSGPTVEDIDPVRFITNRSTGKMGFALAERAAWRGAQVTLISGPSGLATPDGVRRLDIRSATELQAQMAGVLGSDLQGVDALLMAAAVADHRPQKTHETKLKRVEAGLQLDLVANPDLLAEIGKKRQKNHPVLVGFAVETGPDDEIEALAKEKLIRKGLDLIVANPGAEALGREDNRAQLISTSRSERLPRLHKSDLADRILDELVRLLTPA
ncbi:MAG TPA: bifunctional phosphopantothenoylcysteine decarboxylase/phosphopantothenate--cysteine ligase CoaBC [Polyangiaceae bacterium]|nr:bifunctional phosphopantothenoylcysteine decarboxylase/phosphopantothenate--cysteine ligase CoaBC [Polyangiaceae bacterium]